MMGRRATLRAVAVGVIAVAALGQTANADAFWSTEGTGDGGATVGTVSPPTNVAVTSFGPTVTVSWTEVTPPEGTLAGYTITRYAGSTPSDACGTDPATTATFIPAGTTTCDDTSVPDGTYAYTVTAVFRTWTAQSVESNAITVIGDEAKPHQTVTLAGGASNAHLVGATLYYRATASGSFRLVDTVTAMPSGPASATFPDRRRGWVDPPCRDRHHRRRQRPDHRLHLGQLRMDAVTGDSGAAHRVRSKSGRGLGGHAGDRDARHHRTHRRCPHRQRHDRQYRRYDQLCPSQLLDRAYGLHRRRRRWRRDQRLDQRVRDVEQQHLRRLRQPNRPDRRPPPVRTDDGLLPVHPHRHRQRREHPQASPRSSSTTPGCRRKRWP